MEDNARIRKMKLRVLIFALLMIVFVAVLTVERNAIMAREVSEQVSEDKTQTGGAGKKAASNVKASDKLKFEELSFDSSNLLKSDFVSDLPSNAVIELKLGDNYYSVTSDAVSLGRPANPDLTISLPQSYGGQISGDLCETIRKANKNRDLGIEMHASEMALAWKYRGMLKYKDCLS